MKVLVVVDMQNDFITGSLGTPEAQAIVPNVKKKIDEAPMVYKPMDEIIENIKDTVDILEIIKPVYNFKASEG